MTLKVHVHGGCFFYLKIIFNKAKKAFQGEEMPNFLVIKTSFNTMRVSFITGKS